jgi:L-fuculose-phosphate aldolase
MTDQEAELRQSLVQTCREMQAKGLTKGTSGNISVRSGEGFLISPTGIPYQDMQPDQVVRVRWDGSFDGPVLPSSEWRFHAGILKSRDDLNAVVHNHSQNATAVSILGRAIPPIHYMIAVAGGEDIRCAPYATFGTQALADLAVTALAGRRACLLAHHGMIAAHSSLAAALKLAEWVEELAALYLKCLAVGEPPVLNADQIAEVLARFRSYGQQRPPKDQA